MRSSFSLALMMAPLAGALAAFVTGCPFNSAEDCYLVRTCISGLSASSGTSGDGGPNPACVPSENDAPVDDACGVFVSSSAGDDDGEGSKAKPLKSLVAAVEMAAGKGTPVYACAEEFAGSVTLTSGVALFGGLACEDKWAYVGGAKKSALVGGVDEIALTITKTAGGAEVADFMIRAADAKTAGSSSIAVLAEGVTAGLVRCDLVAGNGATGAVGASGDPNGMPAASGAAGNAGKNACSDLDGMPGPDATVSGGAQITNDCGGVISIGGSGGDGNVPNGGGGDDGQPGAAGLGGKGEPGAGMWSCIEGAGQIGSSGEAGTPGAGALGLGTIASSGYMGTSGGAGTSGKVGQGGGGGGGAKGGLICLPGNMNGSGASGGSGGAGGCGGLPGQGGGPGGASIALVSVQASITLTECTLTSGKGGDGGAGGDAQPGGPGGDPGKGGQGAGVSNPGCSGGQGGKGGNGGPGGGGLGGPSLGIAFQGAAPQRQGKTNVTPGTPGAGGPGGSANTAMNQGEAGTAAEEQEFP